MICVLCLVIYFSLGFCTPTDGTQTKGDSSPMEFPKKSLDESTPIVVGGDPKLNHLPPRTFPNSTNDHDAAGHPILSGSEANITELKNHHDVKLNATQDAKKNTTLEHKTEPQVPKKESGEQDDMLHSKYKGGTDVDELLKPEKKATEKDEKKPFLPKKDKEVKKDPKDEVEVSVKMDKQGPKLMTETKTKSGESVLESTSKMMAVSSEMLSHQTSYRGIIDPAKTVATVLLSLTVVLGMGTIGLLVWKKIAMRRYGRDVLINEEDFDEVSDMHTFDRAQIQIT